MEDLRRQHVLTYLLWAMMIGTAILAAWQVEWGLFFVAMATLALSALPVMGQKWSSLRLPSGFTAAIVAFIAATLLAGEAFNFYERFWWWDMVVHTGSAIGFAMIGTVVVLAIVRGQRLDVPPILAALLAFAFALAIGALWEIFEFTLDRTLGTSMQKGSLTDTMTDLVVDAIGALIGAGIGYRSLRGGREGPAGSVDAMARQNLDRAPSK